jgi:hypothetical protein
MLAPELAAGIARMKSGKCVGVRAGGCGLDERSGR